MRVGALALLWGTNFLWIKIALESFSPVQVTWIRLALGAAVLGVVAYRAGHKLHLPDGMWGHVFVAAFVANALPYALFGIGELWIGSNLAGLLNATTPIFTVLLAAILGIDRSGGYRRGVGVVLGFLGALLMLQPWQGIGHASMAGAILCLLASLSYAVSYLYMGRYLASRGVPSVVLSACQLGAAAVLVTLAVPFGGLHVIMWQWAPVASLLVLGVLGTGVAYVLNYRIIADEGPAAASTVTYLLPLVAVGAGFVVLGERVNEAVILGGMLTLVGVAQTRRTSKGVARSVAETAGSERDG